MRSLSSLALMVALLSSCASRPPPAGAGAAALPPFAVEIVLEHVPAADLWRVSYKFPEPVRAVRFKEAYPFRLSNWKAERIGVRLLRDGSDDLLSARQR
jgi:hypothetical protein